VQIVTEYDPIKGEDYSKRIEPVFSGLMSEKERLSYKERIKKLEIKRIERLESLAGKIGVVVACLLFITALIVTLIINT
jgi:hypothetical protein